MRLVERAKVEEQRNELRVQSYGSWQIINTIRQIFGSQPLPYLEYIETLGLLTKEDRVHLAQLKKVQAEQAKQEAKKAHETAAKILELDQERFARTEARRNRKRG